MNFYPDQLRRIADILDAFDQIDGAEAPVSSGSTIGLPVAVALSDEHGQAFGRCVDEIGGAWSWYPPESLPA